LRLLRRTRQDACARRAEQPADEEEEHAGKRKLEPGAIQLFYSRRAGEDDAEPDVPPSLYAKPTPWQGERQEADPVRARPLGGGHDTVPEDDSARDQSQSTTHILGESEDFRNEIRSPFSRSSSADRATSCA
jgi:hypothetical protein